MDEEEIKCALETYPSFGGVYARDELPSSVDGPKGFVVNTDVRASPGSHWVAILISEDGKGELFDSLASQEVLTTFKQWMENNCTEFLFPLIPIQSSISKLCGLYCISFLAMRYEGLSFSEVINCFTQNPLNNDLFLVRLLKQIKEPDAVCKDHFANKNNGKRSSLSI